MKTEWFPSDIKPKRKGVYEVRSCVGEGFAHWDGKAWGWTESNVKRADAEHSTFGAEQNKEWRGVVR